MSGLELSMVYRPLKVCWHRHLSLAPSLALPSSVTLGKFLLCKTGTTISLPLRCHADSLEN